MADIRFTATDLAEACNISVEEAEECIQQYDEYGDGTLDTEDFANLKEQILAEIEKAQALEEQALEEQALEEQALEEQREKVAQVIDEHTDIHSIDDNKDGKVSAYELAQATGITTEEAELLIHQYDENGDGYLQPQEFENLKQEILQKQEQKRRLEQQQRERQQRQQQQQQQYADNNDNDNYNDNYNNNYNSNNNYGGNNYGNNHNNNDSINPNDDKPQEFKHKWKFGMNFDPKNENVVIYISDEITQKNWGITLTKQNFGGAIRQEYRKLGGVISNGSIKYDYPPNGGPLGVTIEGKNGERYVYSCPQQYHRYF